MRPWLLRWLRLSVVCHVNSRRLKSRQRLMDALTGYDGAAGVNDAPRGAAESLSLLVVRGVLLRAFL